MVARDAYVQLIAAGTPACDFFVDRNVRGERQAWQLILRSPAVVNLMLPRSTATNTCACRHDRRKCDLDRP